VVVPRHAHDADRRRGGHRQQLRGEAGRVAQTMLLVEEQEIESGETQDLDDLRIAQERPATENVLAFAQALLETVGSIHVVISFVNAIFYVLWQLGPLDRGTT